VGQARVRCQGREEGPWIEECRGYAQNQRERLEADLSSDQVPIHPLRLCREIGDFLSRDATLVLDGEIPPFSVPLFLKPITRGIGLMVDLCGAWG